MASIPCADNFSAEAAGMCATNIDGVCIRGGVAVAGASGYGLASLGMPATTCVAFPLFAAGNQRYSGMGWDVTSNLNPLRVSRPIM